MATAGLKPTELLIDGDYLVYCCATTAETVIEWDGDGILYPQADLRQARQHVNALLDDWVDAFDAEVRIAISDPKRNWRRDIYPEYKAKRRQGRKPLAYHAIREFLQEAWAAEWWPTLEADDVLGVWATEDPGALIVSEDKDLKTVPGWHWNPAKPELEPLFVTEEEADRYFLLQALMGDSTDGIPGCPGVGPKTAEKIFNGDPTWEKVVAAYANKGLSEEEALTQARLVRILRNTEYGPKGPVLWEPTSPNGYGSLRAPGS